MDERSIILSTLREFKFSEKSEFIVEDDFEGLAYQLIKRLGLPYDFDEDFE
jgi:hypothetical protein